MQSKQQLEEVIRSKFAEAVERKDHAQAVRFAKLYPPLQVGRQPGMSDAWHALCDMYSVQGGLVPCARPR